MATTPIKSLSEIKNAMSNATTPTEFPTTMDTTTEDTTPNVTMETEDKSTPNASANTAPSVTTNDTTSTILPGLIDFDETTDTQPVKLGSITRIEGNVTSKTSTPMSIAGEPDKVIPTIVSVEQMAQQLKAYVDNYLKKNTSMTASFKDHKEAKICGEAFLNLVNYVVGCNHPQIYDAVYTFFKEHRNGVLQEMYALQGINYLKKEESMRAQIFYQVFASIAATPRRSVNVEVVRNIFPGEQGNTFINYLIMKTSM